MACPEVRVHPVLSCKQLFEALSNVNLSRYIFKHARMDVAIADILDFTKPFDCTLVDQILLITMDGSHPQRTVANDCLLRLKDHPDTWKRADAMLETSQQLSTKIFALQVLEEAINTKWKVISSDERTGIRNYVVSKIIAVSGNEQSMRNNVVFLGKINLVLVNILKQDWPHNWPTFISDLVMASKTSESLCENNMKILRLLSEEIFDYSRDSMTAARVRTLKESLTSEFEQVYELCNFILNATEKPSLILATLQTLEKFLTWIPLQFVFGTGLINGLIEKFLPVPAFRTGAIDCLTEIASFQLSDIPANYHVNLQTTLVLFIQQLSVIIPRDVNLVALYDSGSEDDCLFVQRLALFLGTFLRSFLSIFEVPSSVGQYLHDTFVIEAIVYLVRISEIPEEEMFKTCLEFWLFISKDFYNKLISWKSVGGVGAAASFYGKPESPFKAFDQLLHNLRVVMIDHMAKPEEVIIVEDENGEIVREQTKDTEVIAQYKTMREILVYLSHLNYEDVQAIMLEKLDSQVIGGNFSWNGLNTLCWAIGSISGATSEMDEKRFLVSVIKDLLRLCEDVRGKENKAIVASNIMYIVGQYPRFLRAHWKFLKTVVNKLFEFMHEYHPGVQDMACDTFLKIAQKCKRKFMTPQVEDDIPFIMTLISELQRHTGDLQPHQVQSFYESVGTMLSDQGPSISLNRGEVMLALMASQNIIWRSKMNAGVTNVQTLLQVDTIKELQRILKINTKVCTAVGPIYIHQLTFFYLDLLQVYHLYSEQVIAAVAQQGPIATRHTLYKAMRSVKSEILDLLNAFFEVAPELEGGAQSIKDLLMPALLDEVLTDYRTSPPAARDPKVLNLFATIICTLREHITADIPRILDAVFQPTLELITTNMQDHPEHRVGFFKFLRQANEHCFYGLFSIPSESQKLVVDSIVWAFKHTERNISEAGLEILEELLQKVSKIPEISDSFFQTFLLSLIQDVMSILTDRMHKSGFRLQAPILRQIFHAVQLGQVRLPLFDCAARPDISDNATFLKEHVCGLLVTAFPNVTKQHVMNFVMGLFDTSKDIPAFKQHLRDFLVTVKEFESEDNSGLFAEEAAEQLEISSREQWQYRASVPGLLKPDEIEYDPEL